MLDFIFNAYQRYSGVIVAFFVKVSGTGLAFLFSIILARLLGANGIGIYFIAFTIVSIGMTISRLGLDNAVLRFASVAHSENDLSTLASLYRKSFWITVIAGIGISFCAYMIFNSLHIGNELRSVLSVMLLGVIPGALILLQGEFFKAIKMPGLATFVQVVILPLILVIGAIYLFWEGNSTVNEVAYLFVIGTIFSLLLSGLIWNHFNTNIWQKKGVFDTQLLLRTSLPLLMVSSMNLIMGWTDVLLLGAWTDSNTVGIYGISTRIASLTVFILTAVNSVVAPRFASMYALGEQKKLERLAQRSTGWMLVVVLPVVLFLLIFPDWVLQFFGSEFVKGSGVLRVLVIGQFINVCVGSVGYLLMMTGHEKLMRNNILFTACINLTGNIILIPLYGAMGAAMSTSFSIALMNVISFLQVREKLRINTLGYFFKRPSK